MERCATLPGREVSSQLLICCRWRKSWGCAELGGAGKAVPRFSCYMGKCCKLWLRAEIPDEGRLLVDFV